MKIGVCVNLNEMAEIPQKLSDLRAGGFDNCQLLCWRPALFCAENAETLKRQFAEAGVTISAFWCGWEGPSVWNFYDGPKTLGLLPPEYRAQRIQNLCSGCDFALGLGVLQVATHMGFIPENPNDPEFLPFCDAVRTVALHAKANGQTLLFETGQETPVAMLRCFETVGSGNLGVNLDTANLILYGKANPVDALEVFGRYVRGLHAKDGFYPTNGHDLGTEARLGDGRVDFRALFKKLHELGYDGCVTIEREISGEQQKADIAYAKAFLTTVINETYGGNTIC